MKSKRFYFATFLTFLLFGLFALFFFRMAHAQSKTVIRETPRRIGSLILKTDEQVADLQVVSKKLDLEDVEARTIKVGAILQARLDIPDHVLVEDRVLGDTVLAVSLIDKSGLDIQGEVDRGDLQAPDSDNVQIPQTLDGIKVLATKHLNRLGVLELERLDSV